MFYSVNIDEQNFREKHKKNLRQRATHRSIDRAYQLIKMRASLKLSYDVNLAHEVRILYIFIVTNDVILTNQSGSERRTLTSPITPNFFAQFTVSRGHILMLDFFCIKTKKHSFKSDFLRASRIGRHLRKIDFSFIPPKHTFG